jgi:hypothetical protein
MIMNGEVIWKWGQAMNTCFQVSESTGEDYEKSQSGWLTTRPVSTPVTILPSTQSSR